MTGDPKKFQVAVVGTGVMGVGIAQVAAMAGHKVVVLDERPDATKKATEKISKSLARLEQKGKLQKGEVQKTIGRLNVAKCLSDLSGCNLVIEAISESLKDKFTLFQRLEGVCPKDAVLASNTSAIPLDEISVGLEHPKRFAGLHFFNPAQVMKLVEVVRHDRIDENLPIFLSRLMESWGKVPIIVKSAPGFVVNRISRPFYIEALRLHEEEEIPVDVIDECMRACAGFRMGPFELMDLIGNDVNCANNAGIFKALGNNPRIEPGSLQAAMVAAGKLGKKSGAGFYDYSNGKAKPSSFSQANNDGWPKIDGLFQTTGKTASSMGTEVAVHDWFLPDKVPAAIAVAFSSKCGSEFRNRIGRQLEECNIRMHEVPDIPGLVVLRMVSMLVAMAADALADKVSSLAEMEKGMLLGMNHPHGPKSWLEMLGPSAVSNTLDSLEKRLPKGRYKPCDLGLMTGV